MEKPRITKGEWKLTIQKNGMDYYIHAPECMVMKMKHSEYWEDKKEAEFCIDRWMADAKAISSVPELIDALIDIYSTYRNPETGNMVINKAKWIEIEKALKKAGCYD